MQKIKSTKRALLSAVLALMLCIAMLIGTTYAWFTDSVTSGRNTIVSGNLDVELYYSALQADGTWSEYAKVTVNTKVFSETAQYEPGYTEVVKFKVANEGSLALKYNLKAIVYNEIAGVNVNDEELYLSNFLKTGIVDVAEVDGKDRDTVSALATNGIATVSLAERLFLEKGATAEKAMIITMPSSVDNHANYKKSDDPADPTKYQPSIELGVELVATQYTGESDSFGTDYDNGAYMLPEVYNADELKSALEQGQSVQLGDDIDLNETVIIPAAATGYTARAAAPVVLDLNGKTVTATKTAIKNDGNLVITGDGVIDLTSATAQSLQVVDNHGVLTLNGGTYKGAETMYSYAIRSAGSLIINNAVVQGGFGGIAVQANSTAVIEDGTFSNSMDEGAHVLIAWNDSEVTINGGNFVGHQQTNNYVNYTVFAYQTGKVAVNGGNFVAQTGSNGQKTMFGGNIVLFGGTFDVDPTAYAQDGYQVMKNADGTWSVVLPSVSTPEELMDAIVNDGGVLEIKGNIAVDQIGAYDFSTGGHTGISKEATLKGGTLTRESGNGHPLTVSTTETVTFEEVTFESVKGGAVLETRTDGANIVLNGCVFNNQASPSTGNVGMQIFAQNVTVTFTGCTFNNMPIITNSSYPKGIKLVFNNCNFTWTGANCPAMLQLANYVEAEVEFNGCEYVYDAPLTSTRVNDFVSTSTATGTCAIKFKNFKMIGTAQQGKIWSVVSKGGVTSGKNVTVTAEGTNTYTFNGEAVDFATYLFK